VNQVNIAILAYDGCLASELFGFRDVLMFADQFAKARGVTRLSTNVVTLNGKEITTSGGERLRGTKASFAGSDLVVVPGLALTPREITLRVAALKAELLTLAAAAKRGKRVASICVGAFLLGAAGLLHNRRATTAWLFADQLARFCPTTIVERESLIVEDGPVTTTGAFSAAHDLALRLAAEFTSAEVVRDTRRLTLVEGVRSSQAPFIDQRLIPPRKGTFSDRVVKLLLTDLAQPYSLTAIAATASTTPRTLLRRFKAEQGQTPLSFLQAARIDLAKRLLEATSLSIDQIAERVGYRDVSAFRALFQDLCAMPPGAYRKRFT
jgi:transcriptional regulator GlxA family with amidase domain